MIASVIKKYIWIINLILLAGISYTIAKTVTDRIKEVVTPPTSEALAFSKLSPENPLDSNFKHSSPRSSYDVILKRNIFNLKRTSLGSSGLSVNEVPQTKLNLELLGTVLGASGKSAIIKNLDAGKVRGYVEGELIDIVTSESVKLTRIESCIAIVERGEGPETIKCKKEIGVTSSVVSQPQPGQRGVSSRLGQTRERISKEKTQAEVETADVREVSDGVYEVNQKMLEEALSDPNHLVTQARAIPQEDGLKFFAIRPNSIFFKIGLRNGDVIHKINDVEMDNIENAFSLFEELRGQTNFSINLSRRGQNLTYEYTIK
ncbi:MAG: type II secretion system protein GspC [Thermodesulfobacteriota bacterium]